MRRYIFSRADQATGIRGRANAEMRLLSGRERMKELPIIRPSLWRRNHDCFINNGVVCLFCTRGACRNGNIQSKGQKVFLQDSIPLCKILRLEMKCGKYKQTWPFLFPEWVPCCTSWYGMKSTYINHPRFCFFFFFKHLASTDCFPFADVQV